MPQTRSTTYGLILGTKLRSELLAIADSPESVALVVEECLDEFDLTQATNVGTHLQIAGIDFSFLLPERVDGPFSTITYLIERFESGDDVVDAELKLRRMKLLAAVDVLIDNLRVSSNIGAAA